MSVTASSDVAYSITGAAQMPAGAETTYSIPEISAASAPAGAGAARLAWRLLLVTAGAGATYTNAGDSMNCTTGASRVCSMMRSELRSCGTTVCAASSSVCVPASSRGRSASTRISACDGVKPRCRSSTILQKRPANRCSRL